MKVEFEFEIDDRVEIIELARTGCVIELCFDGTKKIYRVRYFDNGSPQTVMFYADELKRVNAKKK